MEKNHSTEAPDIVQGNPGQPTRTVNFGITEEEDGYSYYSVTVPIARWDYGSIVSIIVTAEYPNDRMQAVQNNYLDDPEDSTAAKEMEEMQDWRRFAKEAAHQALGVKGVPA